MALAPFADRSRLRTGSSSASTPFLPSSPPQFGNPTHHGSSSSSDTPYASPRRRTISSNRRISAAMTASTAAADPSSSVSSSLFGVAEDTGPGLNGSAVVRKRTKTESLAAALSASSLDHQQAVLNQLPLLPFSSTLPCLSSHTRLPSGGPPKASPLNITELLSLILGYVCDLSPATLAGALQVSKFWFDVGTGPLWNVLRFDDCHVVFDYATMVKEKKKAGLAWLEDPAMMTRFKLYSASVRTVHITEIVSSGDTVDVLILRRRYPLLVPFQNLRNVTLHRLSPHALYKEEFDYAVRSPGMWLDLASTKCCHQVNILSAPPNSYAARVVTLPKPSANGDDAAIAAAMAGVGDPSSLVWIQTSVFVHYQRLTEFVLDMPASWALDSSHALDLLRAIANSPNRAVLKKLTISCPLSPPSPHLPILGPTSLSSSSYPLPSLDIKSLLPDALGAMILGSLPNLEEVFLVASLEDKHVRALARAWPKLRRFTLRVTPLKNNGTPTTPLGESEGLDPEEATSTGGAYHQPKTTLASLIYLASLCPRLEHVAMDILPPTLVTPQAVTISRSYTAAVLIPDLSHPPPLQSSARYIASASFLPNGPRAAAPSSLNSPHCVDPNPEQHSRISLPVFPPSLQSLHLTGLSHMPVPLVLQLAIRSVPSTCDVRIERIELGGIGSLFPTTERAGASMEDGPGDSPLVWARRIAYAKDKLKERSGRGWRPIIPSPASFTIA